MHSLKLWLLIHFIRRILCHFLLLELLELKDLLLEVLPMEDVLKFLLLYKVLRVVGFSVFAPRYEGVHFVVKR